MLCLHCFLLLLLLLNRDFTLNIHQRPCMYVKGLFPAVFVLVLWSGWAAQEDGDRAEGTTREAGERCRAAPGCRGRAHHKIRRNNWEAAEWQSPFRGEAQQDEYWSYYEVANFKSILKKNVYFSSVDSGESTNSGEGSKRVQNANRRLVHTHFINILWLI